MDQMSPERLLKTAIIPALIELRGAGMADTLEVRRFMLAIALQESGLQHRRQVSADGTESGPAASFWQFEKGGGCKGVLAHPAVAQRMRAVLDAFNVESNALALWEAMRYQDIVAAVAARLLIYTLPAELPETADQGWSQYISAWRPGKPHISTWAANWAVADAAVRRI